MDPRPGRASRDACGTIEGRRRRAFSCVLETLPRHLRETWCGNSSSPRSDREERSRAEAFEAASTGGRRRGDRHDLRSRWAGRIRRRQAEPRRPHWRPHGAPFQRGRPGHEKAVPVVSFMARFVDPNASVTAEVATPAELDAARKALRCSIVRDLLDRTSGSSGPLQLVSNAITAFTRNPTASSAISPNCSVVRVTAAATVAG